MQRLCECVREWSESHSSLPLLRYCLWCDWQRLVLFSFHGKHVKIWVTYDSRGFGGLEVACWPLVPKFAGSNSAEAVGFFRAKKFSALLPSAISRPSSSSFHCQDLWWRHLAVQVGTTEDQGLYNEPSAAVHPGALAAGILARYNTYDSTNRWQRLVYSIANVPVLPTAMWRRTLSTKST